jgi:tRNA A-37 threonylcarbamoyl transferase component Bud32/tetratricopeptide (TPR) repeat protein
VRAKTSKGFGPGGSGGGTLERASSPTNLDRLPAAIGSRYQIDREIGWGGMATVYLARDTKHQRLVAIKVLRPELAASLGPERFQREIQVAAQLHHPHILPVYDSGAAQGLLWFTMPYVQGHTLRQRLEREGRLPIADVIAILNDLGRALAYAHRRGVVHRDIKPENVLLGEDAVFLTDFGVAKPLDPLADARLTSHGLIVGTPTYMAPEQAAADPGADHRADLYALGVMGYELLVGEPPFADLPLGALLAAHAVREPEPVEQRRPDVPTHLADAIARCLRKEPADRWGSAEELLSALEPSGTLSTSTPSVLRPLATSGADGVRHLERGRDAFGRFAWRDAVHGLTAAGETMELEAEDLERLGEAAWWVSDSPAALRARERSYRSYLQRGELASAARVALALAEDYFHRLARSVGHGWLRRAERHLEEVPEAPELGWLSRIQMQLALESGQSPEAALALADRTLEIARRVGDTDLEALALQDRGRILVSLGRVDEGMGLIEEAMTAASAGELGPHTTGRALCNMMSTCAQLGDLGRAAEWQQVVHAWSEPHAESGFPGICRVLRAGLLRLRGDLPAAELEATRAAEELEGFLFDAAGEAYYELGEVHLRQGALERAEAMFIEAHARGRSPQPGLALLRLAQGDRVAARAMIERALAEPGVSPLGRAKLLPAMIEITVACGDLDAGAAAAAELDTVTETYTSPALVAAAALGRGRLELARGRSKEALVELHRARGIWGEIELPFELARTRTLLARAYSLLGEPAAAELEEHAAQATLRRIGATSITGSHP